MALQQVRPSTMFQSAWRRNLLINGNFEFWQRGTSKSVSVGEYLADRWLSELNGTTATVSRQAFTVGQEDVPNNPNYFMRYVTTSSAGASNYCHAIQRIEYGVRRTASKTVTLSFWAKADAAKNMSAELAQGFGSGGSPSASVPGLGVSTCSLTTSWQKFTVTTTMPSVTGKTFGTNNDDVLVLLFWFDAGSTYASRTNSLGQQSGTFDIAQVQLEEGDAATPYEWISIPEELRLCQRYYEKSNPHNLNPGTAGLETRSDNMVAVSNNILYGVVPFIVEKRTVPAITLYGYAGTPNKVSPNNSGTEVGTSVTVTSNRYSARNFIQIQDSGTAFTPTGWYWFSWTASAEL